MAKKLILLILVFSLGFCVGCAVNPITGRQELMLLPQQQDIVIGRKYAPEIEKQLGGKIANQGLQNYVNGVGWKIAAVSHNSNLDYHFTALNDKSVNALALPGGYIFITRGMLEKLTTEAQLAAVLAHETVHVVARDSSSAMSREIGIGILLSAATSERTSQGVLTVANLTRKIMGLRYSRKDEQDADLAGLDYLVKAGYNPYGMVETMQMLASRQRAGSIEFFSTHPAPQNRLTYLKQKIQAKYHNLAGLNIGKQDYRTAVLEQLND